MEERPDVLVVDDESSLRWVLRKGLTKAGYDVEEAEEAHAALRLLRQRDFFAIILDINLPGMTGLDALEEIAKIRPGASVLVITAQNSMSNAIEAMRRGAADYFTKPFDLDEILLALDKVRERRELEAEVSRLRHVAGEVDPLEEMIGRSDVMREVFKRIGQVAARETTVLIRGESGTGKELVARAIHYNSARRQGPFVAVNCAAMPAELLESELFGHERGAFTGAVSRKRGRFERAHGGSLFLDEIGDMAPALQTRLLRVLQEKEVERIGGEEALPVDVRILAATNVDLEQAVRRGEFREDLYYRLNVVTIALPPLRERSEDLPALVEYFIRRTNPELRTAVDGVTDEALDRLQHHTWPGNVRELENCIKRAMVLAPGRVLGMEEIAAAGFGAAPTVPPPVAQDALVADILPHLERMVGAVQEESDLYRQVVGAVEAPLLRLVLARTHGNQLQAAKLLGINRNTLRKKLREAGIATDSGK